MYFPSALAGILQLDITPIQATVGNVSSDIGDVIIESSSTDSNRSDTIIVISVLPLFLISLIIAVVVWYRRRLKMRMKQTRYM